MTIVRRTDLFLAAVLALLMTSVPVEGVAQDEGDVTCGWCVMRGDLVRSGADWTWYENVEHSFPNGGNECGWEGRNDKSIGGGPFCSRCGRSSTCHEDFQTGFCHIPCGPEGDLFAALTEIEEALELEDLTTVASALQVRTTGFSFEFVPDAGRIDAILACDPDRVFRTIPVAPEVRDRLKGVVVLHADKIAE